MRYLTVAEVVDLHRRILAQSDGSDHILNLAGLESALAQARTTFEGRELHPTMIEKASALGFSLIQNHPFADGNKRTGHAAMEVFLFLNDHEISATVDEQERVILAVASGVTSREELTGWLRSHVVPRRDRE